MLKNTLLLFIVCAVSFVAADDHAESKSFTTKTTDLDTSATSAKLFNLGSLLGQSPPYGYQLNRPYPGNCYPYCNTGGGGYYPSTGGGYYPSTGGGYYPSTGGGYYPSAGYPSQGGYYPSQGGYGGYPSQGTNILGNPGYGGYGGYGGNGGLRQYYGYWNPDYNGQRNRGYGYFSNTNRYGLPRQDSLAAYGVRERDRWSGGYRGYD